jgi:putative transposase
MRGRRIKVNPDEGVAYYHCMSRTVNGEFLFDEVAREVLRRQIWQIADFCGVQVLTYTILSNHFHVLLRIPKTEKITDSELLRRYRRLYPNPTKYQTARLQVIEAQISSNGPNAAKWRQRQLRLMGDLSSYLKLLKQRFSIWFNRTHKRYGTLWSERFKSVLAEGGQAVRVIAAYIDLNCVRAGLCDDPKSYRFCGYGEAIAGGSLARQGLEIVCGESWTTAAASYRRLLFSVGSEPATERRAIPHKDFVNVMATRGELSGAELLRCRILYMSNSGMLGSKIFIQSWACRLGIRYRALPSNTALDTIGLCSLRAVHLGLGAAAGEATSAASG